MRRTFAAALAFAACCAAGRAGAQAAPRTAAGASGSAALGSAAVGDTLRLTLAGSVARALERATPVLSAREDERIAAAGVLVAYGRFLPDLSVGATTYGEQGNPLLSSTQFAPYNAQFYGVNVGIATTYTLFDGLRSRAQLRAAVRQRQAAGLSLGRARQEVAYDVTQAYARVVLDDRLEAVARSILALSQRREAQLQAQVRVGTKAPPDLYRQQAQTRADEAQLIATQARGAADRIALLRRLRLDPAQPVAVGDSMPVPSVTVPSAPAEVAAAERRALLARPDLGAARAEREAADQDVRAARAERLPSIAVGFQLVDAARIFGHYSQNGQNLLTAAGGVDQRNVFSQLGSQVAGVLSLGVSLPVFDQHRTRADLERASVLEERSRVVEEDLRDRVVGEVAQAAADIRAADLTAAAAAAEVAAAEKAFAAVSGRYEVGMANFIDVASAQTALAQARAQREQATVEQGLARQRLALATGAAPASVQP